MIIDSLSFKIQINTTAYQNYLKLLNTSVILFKKIFHKILSNNYSTKKQNLKRGVISIKKVLIIKN